MNETDPYDLMIWPDGTWCYRSDLHEYSYMSDDYIVVHPGTPEYEEFLS